MTELPDLFKKCNSESGFFSQLRLAEDNYFSHPILDTPPGPYMKFRDKEVLVWAVNDYLGLADHPDIKDVAHGVIDEWNTSGPMGARMLTGNTKEHIELEAELADFSDKQAALLCNYGYLGVIGAITALVGPGDTVIIDQHSHSCIIDAATLAQAKSGQRIRPFKHNNMNDLEEQLKIASKEAKGGILVVTEGVFGMSGHLGNLKDICYLKDKYGARLFVDDAHGFGVMGQDGRGTGFHYGVQEKIDLYFSTFAKSAVAIGGFTAGDKSVIDYIRYNSKQGITSKSLPMVMVKSIQKAMYLIKTESWRRDKMWSVVDKLQAGLRQLGYSIGETESPVTPVYIPTGSIETAKKVMIEMREKHDIFVSAITFPIVPMGTTILRIIPTARHTIKDVEKTLNAFADLRDSFNLDLEGK